MPISGIRLGGARLLWAEGEGIPSPRALENNGLLPLMQVQTFLQTPSQLAVEH